jgi:hypothetical protein
LELDDQPFRLPGAGESAIPPDRPRRLTGAEALDAALDRALGAGLVIDI